MSYAGYSWLGSSGGDDRNGRLLMGDDSSKSALQVLPSLLLGYSAFLNGVVAASAAKSEAFLKLATYTNSNRSGSIVSALAPIGYREKRRNGANTFVDPTFLYTHIHTRLSRHKVKDPTTGKYHNEAVPVASEIYKGWWVGGCYGHELDKDWGGVIDLTVEFPESCRGRTRHYISAPTWDGVPLPPAELDRVAIFAVEARKDGDVLVHCAHGRGRSTTVMCACLVKAGLYSTWQEAFKQIRNNRSVCKLNRRMKENLSEWQAQYFEGKNA
eukprot:scaffold7504_cov97-Cylindrotheca_fusiformis.AAC.3